MSLQEFIKKRPYLVWSTRNYDKLSNATILEAVLNYGDWDDFKKVIEILGIKKAAKIFREKSQQPRCNYLPKTKHYFKLYFDKYAQ
ncbi:MAG: hypothetical protein ABIF17_01765 [Patescibacteria group bacterium]